jgi:hypothetical protein
MFVLFLMCFKNSIPCDDVLGNVEDFIAGLGGLVSANGSVREISEKSNFAVF